ncbi:MAG: PD-(D/E)XK nuclease family protein, partial [Cyclobacteriaceae bacterium]|nr:PD-(D/E)XK nuclease family protein [Cyclobacteriaceae bacterium]
SSDLLIFRLYEVYSTVMKVREPFDKFYFWGEMLLRDFDELDKYGVNAIQLFKDLSKLRELDETFDYLTDEQREFLTAFWRTFEEKPSVTKEEFLKVWRKLPEVYVQFKKSLKKDKLAYEGMLHREVVESLSSDSQKGEIIFAGFNALTAVEEKLLVHFVQQGAKVFWDEDPFYVNDKAQESGQFLRQYRKHPILGKTFSDQPVPRLTSAKQVRLTGVPQRIGQAKLLGEKLRTIENWDKTVIVLPDESMLLPVLNSLPPSQSPVNVTMGYPLRNTPLYTLLDIVIEMQTQRRGNFLHHRHVVQLLSHPYTIALAPTAVDFKHEIIQKNRVLISEKEFEKFNDALKLLVKPTKPEEATSHLLMLVEMIGASLKDDQRFDREYAFHFHRHLTRLSEVLSGSNAPLDWRGFQKLFRQVVLSQKIPFTGEPLQGLQVMGVLETRNLDFDHVFILSMNEGMLPAPSRQGSYIPNSIRKAYSLPTFDHQDAIYAYLFYRLLQRAGHVELFYNTEPDIIGNGEMSRYVQQLLYEVEGQSQWKVQKEILHHTIHLQSPEPIIIPKSETIVEKLRDYVRTPAPGEKPRYLSPTAINDYIECSLRFYFKYVAGIREAKAVEEDIDYRIVGLILHNVVNWFYEEKLKGSTGHVDQQVYDKEVETVESLIDRAFLKEYPVPEGERLVYEGQRVVVREVIRDFALRILELDKEYAPFSIRMMEKDLVTGLDLPSGIRVRVGGKLDRADEKDGLIRIIDYKTGGDKTDFTDVASLFQRDEKHNKAAFQTLLYALLYHRSEAVSPTEAVQPGLMNRAIFSEDFEFGLKMGTGRYKNTLINSVPLLAEFQAHLTTTLNELYDPSTPFLQTTRKEHCGFCPYKNICYKN